MAASALTPSTHGGKWEHRRDSWSEQTDHKARVPDTHAVVLGKTKQKNKKKPSLGGVFPRSHFNPCHAANCQKHMLEQSREATGGCHSPNARAPRCSVQTARRLSLSKPTPTRGGSNSISKTRIHSDPHASRTCGDKHKTWTGSCINSMRGGCWARQHADLPSEASFRNGSKPWAPLSCGPRTRRGRQKTSGHILSVSGSSHPRQD